MTPGKNIELKARCADLAQAAARAGELGAVRVGELDQTDTYFPCTTGRLKLREIKGKSAELIWYARADSIELRDSDYYVVPVPDAEMMKAAMRQALGISIIVRKRRELWIWENVRIHLDRVENLGTFIEFEAVVSNDANEQLSRQRLDALTSALRIQDKDRIAPSYSDLLTKTKPPH